jgi:arginine decarboxylase
MKQYFITRGSGESNLYCSKNETTSYDDAVVNAGIGNINVVTVSSMIPPEAVEINYITPKWGDIIYCIMARNDGKKGQFISCALLISEVYHGGKLLGSFVLEYSGKGNERVAQKNLFLDLNDMVKRRNYISGYNVVPKKFIYNSIKIKKRYGTVISAICFIK